MPRPLRVTMFFTDGPSGWSESHYDIAASGLDSAIARAMQILVPARINCLAAGPWLKYLRVSFDDVYRDSQVFFLPEPGINANGQFINSPFWITESTGSTWTCALLRGVGGDLYRKQIYLTGIPYLDLTDIGTPQGDSKLLLAINGYSSALIGSYGFPVWQRDTQTYPLKVISAINSATIPNVLTIPNHGFAAGTGVQIFLSKMRYISPTRAKLNGPYPLTSVIDANTITLGNFAMPPNSTFVSGFAQLQTKAVVPYLSVLTERFTHRKRGRPFDSPRGRSRTRAPSVVR